jgi:hypothetical protein
MRRLGSDAIVATAGRSVGTERTGWGGGRCGAWMLRWSAALACALGASMQAVSAQDCPDLAGHYRVDGFGPVLGDALKVLGLQMAGFTDSEVKITGRADTALQLWIKSGKSSPMSTQPSRTLTQGLDYVCAGSSIVLKSKASASRQTDQGWLEGQSTVSLSRSGKGLGLATSFHGRERTTIYSYDSARVSIPKLGTAQRLGEAIRWPNVSEPKPVEYVPIPESDPVQAMRRKLTPSLLGGVNLGGLKDSGDRVLASLNAPRDDDVLAFEDRLRDAGIAYEVQRSPIWSNNGYSMQFLFAAGEEPGTSRWHPSVFRVQHEVERMRHPMVSVSAVEMQGDSYVATLDVIGPEPTDMILKRLRLSTTMFADIVLLDEAASERRNLRHVRLSLRID